MYHKIVHGLNIRRHSKLNRIDDLLKTAQSDFLSYIYDKTKNKEKKRAENKQYKALTIVKKINNIDKLRNIFVSAVVFDCLPIVKFLIEDKKLNVDMVDSNNTTPLIDAVIWWRPEIVKYLVEHGANVNHKDNSGDTPLWCALEHRHIDIAEYLRSKGADINYMNTTAKENFTLKEQAKGEFGLDW